MVAFMLIPKSPWNTVIRVAQMLSSMKELDIRTVRYGPESEEYIKITMEQCSAAEMTHKIWPMLMESAHPPTHAIVDQTV